ncbi:MAG: Arc family DNA-binding protein, partial [Candidatus Dechloromonas phosphoritropha]
AKKAKRNLNWLVCFWLPKWTTSHENACAVVSMTYNGSIDSVTLESYQMANVNVRNLPDEVHRAIRIQAAQHGRSTEAEIRDILERAARPDGRVKLGSFLASIAREAGGLTDEEHALFESVRIKSPARAVSFE